MNPGTAVEGEFIQRVVGNAYAERKVIVLDCCYGAAFANGLTGMDDTSIDIEAQIGAKDSGDRGWCVLTASTSTRYALEQEGEPLSVYTRYLVEGLKTGGAAPDGESFISALHWHEYVMAQVRVAAPVMKPAIFNGEQGYDILIARARVDNAQRYRKRVQKKLRRGRLSAAGKQDLLYWRGQLGLTLEQAEAIEEEILKPYREKQKHLAIYAEALEEEKADGNLFDAEVIQDFEDLQKLFNLRDEDVRPVEKKIIGSWLPSLPTITPQSQNNAQSHSGKQEQLSLYPKFCFETVRVNEVGNVIETISGEAECYTEDLGNGVTLEMLRIPGGKFMMGAVPGEEGASDDEYPQHEVTVPEFWMGKYAVTQAQWRAVAVLDKVERDLEAGPAKFKGKQRPVEQVFWDEAIEFCQRLSQRSKWTYTLPSEAQWEYACRANTKTPFYFGSTITTELANYRGTDFSYQGKTCPGNYAKGPKGQCREESTDVGSFSPNIFSLYDMHGNVWEWCLDSWHDSYEGAPSNGDVWKESSDKRKVLRGGSWLDSSRGCRAANRGWSPRDGRYSDTGFRVCFIALRPKL
ncbi:MAG: formylglycine-generating enzyme family protein [Cyanobacteria bacterium J06626_6]